MKTEAIILACHKSCVSSFTAQHHIDRFVRKRKRVAENDNSVEKITRQSICQTFNFRKHCPFLGGECKDISPKNPSRWRPYYFFRTVVTANNTPFKDFILKICLLRNETWSKEVKFRVESDLHAADTRYHQECKTNFFHPS